MSPEAAARLTELNIQYVLRPKCPSMFTRGNLVILAQYDPNLRRFSLGSTGIMTDEGLSYLMWNQSVAFLSSHGGKQLPATPEQINMIHQFSADLEAALNP